MYKETTSFTKNAVYKAFWKEIQKRELLNYILFKFQAHLELYVLRTQKECNWGNQNIVKVTKTFLQCSFQTVRLHNRVAVPW